MTTGAHFSLLPITSRLFRFLLHIPQIPLGARRVNFLFFDRSGNTSFIRAVAYGRLGVSVIVLAYGLGCCGLRIRASPVLKGVEHMGHTNRTYLIIGFVVVVLLFLFFGIGMPGGGMMDSWRSGGSIMGEHGIFGAGFRWLPTLLFLGLGVALGWLIWGRKRI
jgi:hypothetical protein